MHVYVSDVNKVLNSGVIHTGVSDHSLVYVTVGNVKVSKKGHKYQINREYKHFSDIEFVYLILVMLIGRKLHYAMM